MLLIEKIEDDFSDYPKFKKWKDMQFENNTCYFLTEEKNGAYIWEIDRVKKILDENQIEATIYHPWCFEPPNNTPWFESVLYFSDKDSCKKFATYFN